MKLEPIAHMQGPFPTKFGIPRQSGVVEDLPSRIVFTPEYRNRDALRGLEAVSHLWLIWGFSENRQTDWSPTVRPPRLGGNARMGVFSTRSPYRPNPLGLSAVRLRGIAVEPALGPVLDVLGADLMDGTPIYDIKPYLPYADSIPEATAGFAQQAPPPRLQVVFACKWEFPLPDGERELLQDILAQDPRPAYQADPGRVYGMAYRNFEVKFSVSGDTLTVLEVSLGG